MSEGQIIENTPFVRTRESIGSDLKGLGLEQGMVLMVHSSLSSLGWVCGGAVAVIQALMDVVTPAGTIVMLSSSGDYSDPETWGNPPVPQEWWNTIRQTMPAYDQQITPTRGIGVIPEVFRWPGTLRSSHPALSFAAWGKDASRIVAEHSLDYALGEGSPLARIYDCDGWVLMLGTGYDTCTSLHLAEYRAGAETMTSGAPILENGKRIWKVYEDIVFNTDIFPVIGEEFEREMPVRKGEIGSAGARLFPQKDAVDFAARWLSNQKDSIAKT